MKITRILSDFSTATHFNDIAPEAIINTKRHILDCIGVGLAATVETAGQTIIDITSEEGGPPKALVFGTNLRSGVISTAWANGALSHLLDFDDTGFSHPTACILPAAMALAEETEASGELLVAAICIGLEVFERMSSSGRQHEHIFRARGFHPTSLYGCSAAAAAAGKIAQLDTDQMAVALGLAAANAGGLTQHFGTPGKGIHAGNAARAGVTAVLLARKGYIADPEGLEGDYGFYSAFHGRGNYTFDKVSADLGETWSIVNPGLTIKRYPCCGGNLRALDAAKGLIEEKNISANDVETLTVDVHPDLLDIVRFHKPTVGFRGKFSIDYVLAAMLLDHKVDLDSFSDEYCNAPRMRETLNKVLVNAHEEWADDAASRRRSPVTIRMKDGRTLTKQVDHVRGSPGNPLTRDELVDKYRGCASRTLNEQAMEDSIDIIESLDTFKSLKDLIAALSKS